MQKPVVLMPGAYSQTDMAALEKDYEILKLWEAKDQAQFLAQHGQRVRAIATRGDLGASGALLAALPKLEVIACFGVGTDAIDIAAARARGIGVAYTPEVLNEAVADLALALMLGISREMAPADAHVRSGNWAKAGYPLTTQMSGKRLGLLGMGRIGQAIARRAAGFAMPVSYFARHKRADVDYQHFSSAPELARNSDFLVAIVPGGAATKNLVNAEVLAALGPKGYFINVARGSVADEDALLAALEKGTIAGAGLDVFWNEPNINPRFLALKNVLLAPHVGSGTVETRAAMGQLVRDNLAAHFAGKPLVSPVP